MGVNYGLNKVRFIAPVHVGASVRTRVTLKEVTDVPGGIQVIIEGTFEVKEKVTSVLRSCRVVSWCVRVVACRASYERC
jgi:acyl dehydratase